MPVVHANDMHKTRVSLALMGTFGVALMFIIPWTIAGMKRGHLGNNYEDICNADGDAMYGLRCFRDIGFETFTKVYDLVSSSVTAYMLFAAPIYFSNVFLYGWMVYRLYNDFAVTMLVAMYMVEATAFLVNSVGQIPPPDGFVQLEPETVSFFMGLVTLGNYGLVSMRATMCFMLFYDSVNSIFYRRPVVRRAITVIYVIYCSMFLLFTHQVCSCVLHVGGANAYAHRCTPSRWCSM